MVICWRLTVPTLVAKPYFSQLKSDVLQPEAMSGRRWLRQQGVVVRPVCARHIQIQWSPLIQPTDNCRHLAWFSLVNLASQLGRYSMVFLFSEDHVKLLQISRFWWNPVIPAKDPGIPIGLASHIPCLLLLVFPREGPDTMMMKAAIAQWRGKWWRDFTGSRSLVKNLFMYNTSIHRYIDT